MIVAPVFVTVEAPNIAKLVAVPKVHGIAIVYLIYL
jgi:hypothetical protein